MGVSKERILVVEDLPHNLLVLQGTLEHAGFETVPAANGEEALLMLEQGAPMVDLVLSDVMMPGLSGYGLCRRLRQNPIFASLPIVLITAKRLEEDDALYGMDVGADDYLTRPIDPRLLVKKVEALLARKRLVEQWRARYHHKRDELSQREWNTRMFVHDMRNPLTGAIASLELLAMDQELTARQKLLVQRIQKAVRVQSEMLQDMLSTVAAQSGQLRLSRESFDLGDCVREQIALQSEAAARKGMSFLSDGREIGCEVAADRRLLGRVVANLLVNALKYGESGGIIRVWLGSAGECPFPLGPAAGLALVIANGGLPIAPEDQERIFRPFEQGSGNDSRKALGVGLGLCFCEQIIKLHGGRVGVISPLPGRETGAAFYIVLP